MTRDEYIRWLDEKIAQSERWRDESPEQREKMLHVGYRDAYTHARDQARRITSLATGDDGNGDAQYDYEAAAARERQAESTDGWTETELAFAYGDH